MSPRHPAWQHFTVVKARWAEPKKAHPDVKCNYCDYTKRSAQPTKDLVRHVLQCPNMPETHHSVMETLLKKRSRVDESGATSNAASADRTPKRARHSGTDDVRRVQGPISQSERRSFHRAVARAFYSAAIPFRAAENPEVRALLTMYRPSMTLPTRHDLANALLNEAYTEEKVKVKQEIAKHDFLTVVTDGWSDPNSECVMNFMVVSPFMRPMFWSSVRTSDDKHTGKYVADAVSDVIDQVNAVGKARVCAVVTDNASNMRKSWQELWKTRPSLICNGCSAHTLNLLLQDMFAMDPLKQVLQNAVAVSKFVRKRPALLYRFRETQRRLLGRRQPRHALSIPVSTRWYSSTACISNVIKNEEVLEEIFADRCLMERYQDAVTKLSTVKRILTDQGFWLNARSVLRLVRPVVNALAILERDGCCLSMVFDRFNFLKKHDVYRNLVSGVDTEVLSRILQKIESRWEFVRTESISAAYLLDPSKGVDAFEGDDLSTTINHTVSLAERVGLPPGVDVQQFRPAVLAFVRMKMRWSPDERKENAQDTPLDWWMINNSYPALKEFAQRILSIPTSSAASERSWSVHSFIHSKRRNRLKPARVEKLAFIYSNSGNKDATSLVLHHAAEADTADSGSESSDSDIEFAINSARRREDTQRSHLDGTTRRQLFNSSSPHVDLIDPEEHES